MPVTILAIGDSYMPAITMADALASVGGVEVRYRTVNPNDRPQLNHLAEYQGDPADLDGWLTDETVLVVHAAPVTRELLAAHPGVKLVVCLRGGAVNVDLDAARQLGVAVVNTPGKNAESVADLTMVFVHMLLRGMAPAARWLRELGETGERHLDSTFVGGDWLAREPRGLTLGLIGFGAIGHIVARRAAYDGMTVLAHDPYVDDAKGLAELVGLQALTERSDVVSVHAKATTGNRHLIGNEFISSMKEGAVIINTARQSLVDEDALLAALLSGHLNGAALDVCEPDGRWPELAQLSNVILTPHLGGATVQTQQRGLEIALADIRRFLANEPLLDRVA